MADTLQRMTAKILWSVSNLPKVSESPLKEKTEAMVEQAEIHQEVSHGHRYSLM